MNKNFHSVHLPAALLTAVHCQNWSMYAQLFSVLMQ